MHHSQRVSVHCSATWHCMALHGTAWHCTALHGFTDKNKNININIFFMDY
jgi:hypothetical protein